MSQPQEIDLIPYFKAKIGTTLSSAHAVKTYKEWGSKKTETRYFKLSVIAVDAEANGVWFEGWSGQYHTNSHNEKYHGVTFVSLKGITGSVHAQMVASEQLPALFEKKDYVS